MDSPAWARAAVTTALHRYLLLDVEKAAAGRSPHQQAEIARYFGAATKRLLAAGALSDPSDALPATILLRESICLFGAALAKTSGEGAPAPLTAADALEASRGRGFAPPTVSADDLALLRSTFSQDDPLALDGLPPGELQRLRAAAHETATWLGTRVDPRPVPALRGARRVRVALAVGILLTLLYFFASWVVAPKNIARGKVTTASSRYPGTPPASGATNGEIEAAYGVHTNGEPEAWVMVDLGQRYWIREVRVYNRGDGWQNDNLPLALEVSTDGSAWLQVETRTTPFSQAQPWVAKVHAPQARYVRLRRPVAGFIALSEIEVYR